MTRDVMKNGTLCGTVRRYPSETMFIFCGHVATWGGPRLADDTLRSKLFVHIFSNMSMRYMNHFRTDEMHMGLSKQQTDSYETLSAELTVNQSHHYHCNFFIHVGLYRVSQEELTKLRESVPYVKIYRYNPKHLCPKLNGYGDNDQRSLKVWQLLHTYWLPNSY